MRYRLPSLNALKTFEAVMRHGSIRKAAEELCITPQAVSHQLRQLEEALNCTLFERHVRSVEPTESAGLLTEHVRRGLDHIAEGVARLKQSTGVQKLFLHVSPYFASVYLIRNLANFTRRYPEIDLRISIGVDMVDLAERGIDAAIHWGYGGHDDLVEVPLIDDLKVLACSPELLAREPIVEGRDLLRHTLIAPLVANTLWRDTLALLGIDDARPNSLLHLQTHETMLEATLAGLGVGLISYLDALAAIREKRIVAPFGIDLLNGLPPANMPKFFLLHRRDHINSELMTSFARWLDEYVCREEIIGYPPLSLSR